MRPVPIMLAMLFSLASCASAAPLSASLRFDTDAIDLETGMVYDTNAIQGFWPDNVDFRLNHFAASSPHDYVVQNQHAAVRVARFANTPFASVTYDQAAVANLTADLIAEPFDPAETFVLFTHDGNYFKIGNPIEMFPPFPDPFVRFDYEQLRPVPEPSTFLLAALGGIGLVVMRRRT